MGGSMFMLPLWFSLVTVLDFRLLWLLPFRLPFLAGVLPRGVPLPLSSCAGPVLVCAI